MSDNSNEPLLPVIFIEQPLELDESAREIAKSTVIALDTESNSLHHYPEQLCLIQMATLQKTYLIDTIVLKSIESLRGVLQDPSITKVIHGADYDVRSLDRYGGFRLRNIYDTYIAARFAGLPKVGLADLLTDLLGKTILKSKLLQRADWGRRPLSREALEYAAADVRYLIRLKEILQDRLQKLGRTSWVLEEFSRLEDLHYSPINPETAFLSIKGSQILDGRGLAVLKRLFMFREEEAVRLHQPPFFVIPDAALVYLSGTIDWSINEVPGLGNNQSQPFWSRLRKAIQDGQNAPLCERPTVNYEPLQPEQVQLLARLKVWRASLGASQGLDPSLLWPTTSLERLAKAPGSLKTELTSPVIRKWQREQFASSLEDCLKNS